MFRKELLVLLSLAAAVFLLVAAGGMWVGETIRRDAADIAADTLPSLVDAGAAMALTQENWLRVHLLQGTASAAARAELIHQIRTNSNEGLWRDYGQSLGEPEEQRDYRELLSARTDFVQLREEYFKLLEHDSLKEPETYLAQKLSPAYEHYRRMSQELFEYNARVGRRRAGNVIWIARVAPYILGGGGVVLFGLGFGLGLRGALGGLSLASRAVRK